MAQTDLDSMVIVKTDAAATAEDNLVGYGEAINDIANKEAAAAAGVKDAAFINYDAALDAYAARDDVEDLAHKNARHNPEDFADAAFMRASSDGSGSGSGSGSGL